MKKFLKHKNNMIGKLEKFRWQAIVLLYAILAPINITYGTVSAEQKWDDMINFFIPWIQRLGGAIGFVGAIMFGMGWKQNDPEGKTNGINCIVAGCIIIGAASASKIFLW